MKTRSKVRLSRALGIPLTPKAARSMERRPYPPGQHGRRQRRSTSDYKERLLEKQRLRAQYNLSERQLRRALDLALRSGNPGEALMVGLETRLDALVLRSGFARTIYQARQAVLHGHVTVNGRRVDRPSFRPRPGDVIEVAAGSKGKTPFLIAAAGEHAAAPPPYLEVDTRNLRARLTRLPERAEIPVVCDERLVIEFYSR